MDLKNRALIAIDLVIDHGVALVEVAKQVGGGIHRDSVTAGVAH
jgi:hypothetical protein